MENTVDLKVASCPFCGVEAQKLRHSGGLWRFFHVESCYFSQVDFGRSFHILDADQVDGWNARVAPEVKRCETSTLKVGDLVELRGRNRFNGARGLLTQRHPDNGWFWFEASDPRNRHISGWREETWEDEECGTFRLVKVD
jgi:hypothetical protein